MNAREQLVELREKVKEQVAGRRRLTDGELVEVMDALTSLINMEGILEP